MTIKGLGCEKCEIISNKPICPQCGEKTEEIIISDPWELDKRPVIMPSYKPSVPFIVTNTPQHP